MTELTDLKHTAHALLHQLAQDGDASKAYHPEARWNGPHPVNEITGSEEISAVWAQLRAALPDVERRDLIFVAGHNLPDERLETERPDRLVATMGGYLGTMQAPLFDIPPTFGAVFLRFCEVHHIVDERIRESWVLWDLLDLMRQAGCWPLPPSLGAEGLWCGPATADGVRLDQTDPGNGEQSMEMILRMHRALLGFDGKTLESMPHADYWTEDFMWYGTAGIGATRGLTGFRAHHQIPFLRAFPDRRGAGHYIRIGDGNYAVTGGWPSVRATHMGEWLGKAPTGRVVDMRVMDFYRLTEDGKIAENWVPIDVPHIAMQMGVDLFARLRHLTGRPRTAL